MDSWRSGIRLHLDEDVIRLPLSRMESGSDPLSRQKPPEKTSSRASALICDPLQLFAMDEPEDNTPPTIAEGFSHLEDSWNMLMKPSSSGTTLAGEETLLVPSSLSFTIRELVDTLIQSKEASLSKVQWLENARISRGSWKDPSKRREAEIQTYSELGIPGTALIPFATCLQSALDRYWQEDQKLSAINLVIQVSLMLHDYEDPGFYHAKFYHLSELIYQFGKTTYARLIGKSPGIRINFTHKDVCEHAREEARQWLTKMSTIRELLPRLLIEASLLKTYRLVQEGDYGDILERLSLCIRGVTDPLVNLYTRCFLLRVVRSLGLGTELRRRVGMLNYEEMTHLLNHTPVSLSAASLEKPIKCVLEGTLGGLISDFDKDQVMLLHFRALDMELKHSGAILKCLIESSSPSLISEILLETLIPTISAASDEEDVPQGVLILSLGKILVNTSDMISPHRLKVLKNVWNIARDITDIDLYLEVSLVWIEFLCINFKGSNKELNILFGDIVSHLNDDCTTSTHPPSQLKSLFQKILKYDSFVYPSLSMTNFLPLFQVLEEGSKYKVAKSTLERLFGDSLMMEEVADPVGISVLIYLCQVLTDFISPFTAEDEIRQISSLICSVIRFTDKAQKSPEKRLNFYTELRQKFGFLDRVQYELITAVNGLSVSVHQRVKGSHSMKTKGFVQACLAYAFITIPTLRDQNTQIYAFTHTAQVALLNGALGQAEASLRAALDIIPTLREPADASLNNLLSTALLLPDLGNQPLGILTLAVHQISSCSSITSKVCLNALRILCVSAWKSYPYEVAGLDSNAGLYFGRRDSILAISNELATLVLHRILESAAPNEAPGNELYFELFHLVLRYSDMDSSGMASLAFKLWKLTSKAKSPWVIKSRRAILTARSLFNEKGDNYKILHESILKYENKVASL